MDPTKLEKLAKMQPSVRIGKGTPRRKVKKVHKSAGTDDKKLQTSLKKLNVQPIQAIEEVNMFKEDGNVIHFAAPKVHASVPANTFAIYGQGEDKELTELVPGILNQLGPDSLASLRRLAESYQKKDGEKKDGDSDDDDIPDLVQGTNFESKPEGKDGGSDSDDIPDLVQGTDSESKLAESKPEEKGEEKGEEGEGGEEEEDEDEEEKAEENVEGKVEEGAEGKVEEEAEGKAAE